MRSDMPPPPSVWPGLCNNTYDIYIYTCSQAISRYSEEQWVRSDMPPPPSVWPGFILKWQAVPAEKRKLEDSLRKANPGSKR